MKKILTCIFLVFPVALLAHVPDPSTERGFTPDNVYEIGEIDQVSLFNGNLTVTLPLGPEYQVGGGFTYRFALVYNSGIWDYSYDQQCAVNLPPWTWSGHKRDQGVNACSTVVAPAWQSNAGLGWRLSLGELLPPWVAGNLDSGNWMYIDSSGAEHLFLGELHSGVGGTESTDCAETACYSTDGTYLRLRKLTDTRYAINYPDGRTMVFDEAPDGSFRLYKIKDAYKVGSVRQNVVTVTYPSPDRWVIQDTDGRRHEVDLWLPTADFRARVRELRLASVGNRVSTFTLNYDQAEMLPGCSQDEQQIVTLYELPRLRSLVLPDGASYAFEYQAMAPSASRCSNEAGLLRKADLPTGGRIEWEYDLRYKNPVFVCDPAPGSGPEREFMINSKVGVVKRTLFESSDGRESEQSYGVWQYDQRLPEELLPMNFNPNCTEKPSEVTTVVVHSIGEDRDGDEKFSHAEHFFSVYSGAPAGPLGDPGDYGLPYHGDESEGVRLGPDQTLYKLQSRLWECDHDDPDLRAGCAPLRSNYVRYERSFPGCDPAGDLCTPVNHRVVGEATVYEDAQHQGETIYHRVDRSCFDGFGNFRREVLGGNFPDQGPVNGGNHKVIERRYNPERGVYPATAPECTGLGAFALPGPGEGWPLGTYDREAITESGVGTTVTLYDFDSAGFLRGTRRLESGNGCSGPGCQHQGPGDLVTLRTRDEKGWLLSEYFYGGDGNDSSAVRLDQAPPAGWEYRLRHQYLFESDTIERTSAFLDPAENEVLITERASLDADTRLPIATWDAAGLATSYAYDDQGRLTRLEPPGEAATVVTYQSTTAPFETTVERKSGGAVLFDELYTYDAFGRLESRERSTPGGRQRSEHRYLANGWKQSDSEVVGAASSNPPQTSYLEYDPLGRARWIEPPDGENYATEIELFGDWLTKTTQRVKRGAGAMVPTSRWQWLDRQGRLYKVEELSSGTREPTFYKYDNEERLRWVQVGATASGVFQRRTFDYDHRGFLKLECHPELGQASAPALESCITRQYDSQGNPLERRFVAWSGPQPPWSFDLQYRYDRAGRRTQVLNQGERLKEYFYGRDAAFGQGGIGRLVQTKRLNRLPVGTPLEVGVLEEPVTVTETLFYEQDSPRIAGREVRSSSGRVFDQSFRYNALGQIVSEDYPLCLYPAGCGQASPARTVDRLYDEGWLTAIPGFVGGVSYHPNGLWSQIQHANGVTDRQTLYRLDLGGLALPGSLSTTGIGGPRGDWSSGAMHYDGARNLFQVGSDSFFYDGVGRLDQATIEVEEGQGALDSRSYFYDIFGNRTAVTGNGAPGFLAVDPASNRMQAATYDQAGNLTTWRHQYLWDPLSKLVRESGTGVDRKMLYTADDERVAVLSGDEEEWTLRGLDHRVLRRLRLEGDAWVWDQDYVHRAEGPVAVVKPTPGGGETTHHFHLDHLASTRVVTDEQGQRVTSSKHWPFGEIAWSETTEASPEQLRFTGHERDFASDDRDDLDYMHARYYSPWNGRFLSVDPVLGTPTLPQSWNRYAYVRGNPVSLTDPTGMRTFGAIFNAWFAAIAGGKAEAGFFIDSDGVLAFVSTFGPGGGMGFGYGVAAEATDHETVQDLRGISLEVDADFGVAGGGLEASVINVEDGKYVVNDEPKGKGGDGGVGPGLGALFTVTTTHVFPIVDLPTPKEIFLKLVDSFNKAMKAEVERTAGSKDQVKLDETPP
ncbi:MAG: RHS repeat-associated core domain-containing protein [Acidobacteriota bacterium]